MGFGIVTTAAANSRVAAAAISRNSCGIKRPRWKSVKPAWTTMMMRELLVITIMSTATKNKLIYLKKTLGLQGTNLDAEAEC
jgi:hypothetical protein